MKTTDRSLLERLAELRESFDRSFREPPPSIAELPIELLAIRVGRDPFALRLSEVAALDADRTITSLPSRHSELLGIAGMRGSVVAVFDLASLLALPRPDTARWLVLAKGAPVAFAFAAFEGQRAVTPEAIARAVPGQAGSVERYREVVRWPATAGEAGTAPLIDIPGLVASLARPGVRGKNAV